MSTVSILLSAFILSVVGLLMFIVSTRYGLLDGSQGAAGIIFGRDEIGRPEEPAATGEQRTALEGISAAAEPSAPPPPPTQTWPPARPPIVHHRWSSSCSCAVRWCGCWWPPWRG